ncbi:MAG: patatin-like phospholipase family protein [Spirochaetes bacterium]|nr:patatin-like phospholipase family protein [Spirochaetota bacterium]
MKTELPFQSVVFAGGGSRCLWQVGFWEELRGAVRLEPRIVAGVSAGAAMACMILSGRVDEGLRFFAHLTSRNRRNAYFRNLFGRSPVFPHYDMYRSAILHAIGPGELETLRRGPDIRILMARPPRLLGPRSATLLGMGAYSLEKLISGPVHPVYASRLGYTAEVASARDCRTPEELADLIIASSCTPPFVPVMRWRGGIALDGGLIDNVPVAALDERHRSSALVLLTRRYPQERIPAVPGRTYVQPSVPIGITKWDYTNPRGLQEARDLGRRDAAAFLKGMGATA